jgi:phosphoribosylformylglycinamidine synthase subunit PurL
MEIWVVGPDPTDNFAGSYLERLNGPPGGRPTAPDPEAGLAVVDEAVRLASLVPVLHDVSDGGMAVAVAEICIASGVGAIIETDDPAVLFGEDPHRFVVVTEPGWDPPPLARRVGRMGGDALVLGDESVSLAAVAEAWRGAIPSALR